MAGKELTNLIFKDYSTISRLEKQYRWLSKLINKKHISRLSNSKIYTYIYNKE